MTVHAHVLIQAPGCRYMIDHDITDRIATDRIISSSHPGFAAAEAHIADHYIVCIDPNSFAGNTNSVARCSLSCNSNIRSTNDQWSLDTDDTCNIKYNYSCATLFTCPAKTAGTIIVKIRYDQYFSTTAAKTEFATAFSTGKCGNI